jgi:hypothetical protein
MGLVFETITTLGIALERGQQDERKGSAHSAESVSTGVILPQSAN